ncbi:MAG: HlyD family efflux transporter periplasmic adaptor subunit [Bacteroidota bacterium]
MKKRYFVAFGILAAAIGGSVAMVQLRPDPPQQPPPPQTPLVQTVAAEEESGNVLVSAAGTIRARDIAAVASQVGGRVVYVAPQLKTGGRVSAGQVLIRLDAADYQNRVEQARADVAAQDVAVLQAEEEAALARDEYDQFAERRAARRASPYTGVDADDYASRVLPPESEDLPRLPEADPAPPAPSPLTLRQPQLDAARAARQRAGAALNDAQLALSRTVVRAPFSGIVQSETIAVGDVIGAGAPFAQIIASDALEAVVPLSNDQVALIPELFSGGTVRADLYADFGALRYRWPAVVDRVDATLDEQARTVNVVFRVPKPISGGRLVDPTATGGDARAVEPTIVPSAPPPLLVGTYVEAEVQGARLDRYLVIPRRALRNDDRIWTVAQDSLLRVTPVDVIQQVGERVLLQGDIEAGTPIVTNDLQGVVDGMTVRVASREGRGGPPRQTDGSDQAALNR